MSDATYEERLLRALEHDAAGFELYQFDPLGNRLSLSRASDDCPAEGCRMTFPHLHSLVLERWNRELEGATLERRGEP